MKKSRFVKSAPNQKIIHIDKEIRRDTVVNFV